MKNISILPAEDMHVRCFWSFHISTPFFMNKVGMINTLKGCPSGSGGCLDFGSTPQSLGFDFPQGEYLAVSEGP